MNNTAFNKISTKRLLSSTFIIWVLITSIHIVVSLVDLIRNNRDFEYFETAAFYIIGYSPWLIFAPLLYRFLESNVVMVKRSSLVTLFTIPFLIIIPIYALLDMSLYAWRVNIEWSNPFELLSKMPAFFLFFDSILYSVVFGSCLSLIYYRNSSAQLIYTLQLDKEKAELSKQVSELKLAALQTQLEPHFLFNSLNSISSLIRTDDKAKALTTIRQLSELLRYAVRASQCSVVLLSDEIKFVKDYMALQCVRFGTRIVLHWHQEGELIDLECPPFVLHTLLENTIVHAVEICTSEIEIFVSILVDDSIDISVTNTLKIDVDSSSLGLGLTNLQKRLSLTYGENYQFSKSRKNDLFSIDIRLPIEE